MKLEFIGHACFCLTSVSGKRIITDPYDDTVGYKKLEREADIVTVSHDHFDHSNTGAIKGNPVVIDKPGTHEVGEFTFKGYTFSHDDRLGAKRGNVIVFVWSMDGIKICHMGDLGEVPLPEKLKALGKIDLLLIPVGGIFTIDAMGAKTVKKIIDPEITIPMHFSTPLLDSKKFRIDPASKFYTGELTRKIFEPTVEIDKSDLPRKKEVWVVPYTG